MFGKAIRTRRRGAWLRMAAAVLVPAAVLALGTASPARSQALDLTMGILPSPGSLYQKMMLEVPERFERATGGKVVVTLNDSLVGGTQITASVRDGRVPMSGALHTYLAGEDPRMGIFNLPGLVDNMAEYAYPCASFWCTDLEKLWEGW